MEKALLDLVINSEKVVGYKQVLKSIINDTVRCVLVSEDCDEFIKLRVAEAAKVHEVGMIPFPSMKELGKLCGIDVGAAVCGILKA